MPQEWETFYFMTGSSAGALIGLLFVVVTLTASADPAKAELGSRTFVTPTVVHFCTVLLIGAISIVPGLSTIALAIAFGVVGLLGFLYAALIVWRMTRGVVAVPHWTDYVYYGALPAVAYLLLLISGIGLSYGAEFAYYGVAAGALALLFIGIRDAWDLAVWLTFHRER